MNKFLGVITVIVLIAVGYLVYVVATKDDKGLSMISGNSYSFLSNPQG
ncbi:MAG: hypothetical protein AAB407_02055 [Patescibacteria group bacterium]